jgi:hypothetical protein
MAVRPEPPVSIKDHRIWQIILQMTDFRNFCCRTVTGRDTVSVLAAAD